MNRIAEVFADATELSEADRSVYLDEACGSDAALRSEVESLLAYHRPDTVTDVAANASKPRWRERARTKRLSSVAAALALLSATAGFVGDGVLGDRVRRDVRARLETTLNANIGSLEEWFEHWRGEAERWSERPDIRMWFQELVDFAAGRDARGPELVATASHRALATAFAPLVANETVRFVAAPSRENIVVFLSTMDVADEVNRLTAEGARRAVPVFDGQSVVTAPHLTGANRIGSSPGSITPQILALAPVTGEDGTVIAALSIIILSEPEVSRRLSTVSAGPGSDTFAFDRTGVMVSHSRYEPELVALGILPDEETSPVLRVMLREPSGSLTKMATLATAGESSMDLEGYVDVRGRSVVGAWRWLPQYNIGVATEIESAEAYALLRRTRVGFALLTAIFGGAAATGFYRARNREPKDVVEATRLGRYEIETLVGEGGMAKVYRAQHDVLQRPVAIKILKAESAGQDNLARFEREVRLVSRLNDDHTIRVFDYGQMTDGRLFYVMELVQGKTLAQAVQQKGAFPPERVVSILKQVCASLGEAHELGIVHRDIKPSNIMLSERTDGGDHVKVLDFGLARTIADASIQITHQNILGGTPAYIAPERILDPANVDIRSDLYALGAVAYYLLTGEDVVSGTTPQEVLAKATLADARRPSERRDGVPATLDLLIMRCLARDPDDRPATAREILDSL